MAEMTKKQADDLEKIRAKVTKAREDWISAYDSVGGGIPLNIAALPPKVRALRDTLVALRQERNALIASYREQGIKL